MARPRVFLSSTYYDLKHVRERIERFLIQFGLEPVLFESDNITFEFNKPLDTSCYNEVKTCHMMILIVGGRYGSAATNEKLPQNGKEHYERYISITRKEHEIAINEGIPSFVFIDKNVYAEFQTYKKNKQMFDDKTPFKFAHVDDVNVFRFISILEPLTAIKVFDKVEEIENYLESQVSGMLFLYLQQLRNKKKNSETLNAISELNSISQRMNAMVDAIGKSILSDPEEYKKVIDNQDMMLITFFKDMFYDNLEFMEQPFGYSEEQCNAIIDKFIEVLFSKVTVEKLLDYKKSKPFFYNKTMSLLEDTLKKEIISCDPGIVIDKININRIMNSYLYKIYPIMLKKPEMFEKMRAIFHKESLEVISP